MHDLKIQDVLAKLNTSIKGLGNAQIVKNRDKYGANVIAEKKRKCLLLRFFAQFKILAKLFYF